MKIQIVHNPTSGNGRHNKKDLINSLAGAGNTISYVSTDDEGWRSFIKNEPDQILIAGGDGTIRKVAEALIAAELPAGNYPVFRLVPLGTANNISEALKIAPVKEISMVPLGNPEGFDYGRIKGLQKDHFFLESVGFGIFPELIFETEKDPVEEEDPIEEMKNVLRVLLKRVKKVEAKNAEIIINGITIKGSFLMVELMNIKFLGPNLKFAPAADPGDGYFDLAMISEDNRPELIRYLENLLSHSRQDVEPGAFIWIIPAQSVKMNWQGHRMHIDDMLINDYSGGMIKIELVAGAFHFIR